MAFSKSGKYFMNPHHAKMADGFKKESTKEPAEGSPKEESSEPTHEAQSEGDSAGDMPMDMGMDDGMNDVTCPGCGERFPLHQGLAPQHHPLSGMMPGHGATPTHESHGGASHPMLGGY